MFGNVGLRDRLTFSVFGSAVNEVQRLQNLTKKYDHSVVASEAFVNYCGGEWQTLGQEKLRGVRQKFTRGIPHWPQSRRSGHMMQPRLDFPRPSMSCCSTATRSGRPARAV